MAFVQPDMTFTPGSFAGTGFQYLDENYNTVKQQIANLKQKGAHSSPSLPRSPEHTQTSTQKLKKKIQSPERTGLATACSPQICMQESKPSGICFAFAISIGEFVSYCPWIT